LLLSFTETFQVIMHEDKSILSFGISGFIKTISAIVILLLLLSVATSIYYYNYNDLEYFNMLFSLDKENNIPTRFSSGLLVIASLLFFIIYTIKRKAEEKFTFNWFFLSVIFLLMGLDESVQLHEQTSQFFRKYVKGLHFAWVIPGIIFVLFFGLAYLKFFLNLEMRWKKLFLFSALLYVGGALGVELISNFFQASHGQDNLGYAMLTNFEEILELSGTTLLIYSLLAYLKNISPCYRIDLKT
jgi:hypothetical protein